MAAEVGWLLKTALWVDARREALCTARDCGTAWVGVRIRLGQHRAHDESSLPNPNPNPNPNPSPSPSPSPNSSPNPGPDPDPDQALVESSLEKPPT